MTKQTSWYVWAVVALLVMALGTVAACESDGGGGTDTSNGSDVVSTTDTAAPSDTTTADVPGTQDVGTPNDTTTGDPDTGTGDPDTGDPPGCSRSGLTAAREEASLQSSGAQYVAITSQVEPYDAVLVQIYNDYDGPTEPGTYSLDGINFADCGLCLLAFSDCEGDSCAKTFYAEKGSVEITSLDGIGGQFAATLNNVVFDEVTINGDTFVSTPVPGGETWCVNEHTFDEEVIDPSASVCARTDVTCVDETVADFQLQNCATGEMVSMQTLAGEKKALWFVLAAVWCPACREWIPQVLNLLGQPSASDLEVVFVIGEDGGGNEPSLSECQGYAASYSADANLFYIDHDGEYGFATTFENLWPYPDDNGAFGLPWNAIVDPATWNYEYADGSGQGDLETVLNGLLAK